MFEMQELEESKAKFFEIKNKIITDESFKQMIGEYLNLILSIKNDFVFLTFHTSGFITDLKKKGYVSHICEHIIFSDEKNLKLFRDVCKRAKDLISVDSADISDIGLYRKSLKDFLFSQEIHQLRNLLLQ